MASKEFENPNLEKLYEIALNHPNKGTAQAAGLRILKLHFINKSFSDILKIAENQKMPLEVRKKASDLVIENSCKKDLLFLTVNEYLLDSAREKAGIKFLNEYLENPTYLSVLILLSVSKNAHVPQKVKEFAEDKIQDVALEVIKKSISNNDTVSLVKLLKLDELSQDSKNSILKALEKFNLSCEQKIFNPLKKDGILLEWKINSPLAKNQKEQNQQKNINIFGKLSY